MQWEGEREQWQRESGINISQMFYFNRENRFTPSIKDSQRSINVTQNITWVNAQSAKYLKHKLLGQGSTFGKDAERDLLMVL